MTRPNYEGHEPLETGHDAISDDRERAEIVESAGMWNSFAVAGPVALLMIPVARAATAIWNRVRRR